MTKEKSEPEQTTFNDSSGWAEKDCETPQGDLTEPLNDESNSDERTPEGACDTRDGSDNHDESKQMEDDQWDAPPLSELGESAAPEYRPEPVQIEESIDVPTPPPYDRHLGPAPPDLSEIQEGAAKIVEAISDLKSPKATTQLELQKWIDEIESPE